MARTKEIVKLTKDNLQEWKIEIDKQMSVIMGHHFGKYSDCLLDTLWLELYEGMTPHEAITEEVNCI